MYDFGAFFRNKPPKLLFPQLIDQKNILLKTQIKKFPIFWPNFSRPTKFFDPNSNFSYIYLIKKERKHTKITNFFDSDLNFEHAQSNQ